MQWKIEGKKRDQIKGNDYPKRNKLGIYEWVIKKLIVFLKIQAVPNYKQKIPAYYNKTY